MMLSPGLLIVSASVLTILSGTGVSSSPTKVSIYYESLCPDSVDFVTNQLYPSYVNLKDNLNIDFIPYGKASQSKTATGSWKFSCQHGFNECIGNKYQACALDQKKGQDNDVKLINCLMSRPDPSEKEAIKDCATQNNYDWTTMNSCFEGARGGDLLAAYGDRTRSLKPKLSFVPTVVFDDVYNQELQNESMYDFVKAACSVISAPKPDICKSSTGNLRN